MEAPFDPRAFVKKAVLRGWLTRASVKRLQSELVDPEFELLPFLAEEELLTRDQITAILSGRPANTGAAEHAQRELAREEERARQASNPKLSDLTGAGMLLLVLTIALLLGACFGVGKLAHSIGWDRAYHRHDLSGIAVKIGMY